MAAVIKSTKSYHSANSVYTEQTSLLSNRPTLKSQEQGIKVA